MWYFRSPEVIFGEGALDHLTQLSGKRALIVTDPNVGELGYAEKVVEKLEGAGSAAEIFGDVEAEPSVENIQRGAEAMSRYQPDWVVGLGGGSPLDAAKAMWILYEHPEVDIEGATMIGSQICRITSLGPNRMITNSAR